MPPNGANVPSKPVIIASSPKAAPIPTRPLAISSQVMEPNCCKAEAKSPKPCIAIRIAPPANIPPKGATIPRAPTISATSPRARPIPTRPLAISSHDKVEIDCRAFEMGSKDCTAIRIAPPAKREEIPAKLPKVPTMSATSPNARPIPTRPFAISSHESAPIFCNVFAIGSKA